MSEYGNVQFRLPTKEEVKVSAAFNQEEGVVNLYLYLDARTVMEILDDGVGPMNWNRTHECIGNKVYCAIGVNASYDHPDREKCFISKMDVGTKTPIEKEKGESSDSFKRAAVCWGIGRALYYAPEMIISPGDCLIAKDGKVQTKFDVSSISFSEDQRRIKELVIIERQTGDIVYEMENFKQVAATTVIPPSLHTGSSVAEKSHTADSEGTVGAENPAPRMEQNTSVKNRMDARTEHPNKPVCEPAVQTAEVVKTTSKPVCNVPKDKRPVCDTKNSSIPVSEPDEGIPYDEYEELAEYEDEYQEMTEVAYEQKKAEIESMKVEINKLLDEKIGYTAKRDQTFRQVWRNEQFINYMLNKFTPINAEMQAVKDKVIYLVAHSKIVEMVL